MQMIIYDQKTLFTIKLYNFYPQFRRKKIAQKCYLFRYYWLISLSNIIKYTISKCYTWYLYNLSLNFKKNDTKQPINIKFLELLSSSHSLESNIFIIVIIHKRLLFHKKLKLLCNIS